MNDHKLVIRVISNPGEGVTFEEPCFIKTGDVDAFDGLGDVHLTYDIEEALQFDNGKRAFDFWQAVPAARPTRPDGEPNRPLTAFTVEIATIAAHREVIEAGA